VQVNLVVIVDPHAAICRGTVWASGDGHLGALHRNSALEFNSATPRRPHHVNVRRESWTKHALRMQDAPFKSPPLDDRKGVQLQHLSSTLAI
jgi:hypothetical protein